MLPEILTIANILMFISNIPAIRAVIKDRKKIAGYSISGSLLTIIGLMLVNVWYILMGVEYYPSLIISLASDMYWILAFAFTLKRKFNQLVK